MLLAAVVGGALAVSGTARTTGAGTPERASFRVAGSSLGCTYDAGRLNCSTQVPAEAPVLRPTESWWHGGFACRVEGRGPVCTKIRP
jgi:hypothetical protein